MNVVRIEARPPQAPDTHDREGTPTPGERARRLMSEARSAAAEQLDMLEAAINVVRDLSLDVARGGDIYGVGLRELATQLAEDLLWRGKTLEALTARERAGLLAH